jgi:hypothetical protein
MPEAGSIGIIANPASGKDIRRLVAHGSTFDNNEKINIIRRILIAVGTLGVRDIWYMPDTYSIVPRAAEQAKVSIDLRPLPMPVLGNAGDSTEAAMRMRDLGVSCIVTLGGDGTNRVVARGCGDVPLVPISTGTNNVFPQMVEGTLAGMAAAAVACGIAGSAIIQRPRLDVSIDGVPRDIALIDVVLSNQPWVGSRAFWRADHLSEVVLSHIPQSAIGICSLGPLIFPSEHDRHGGMHARFGTEGARLLCPIAPGLLAEVVVEKAQRVTAGQAVELQSMAGTIALDGEREIELRGRERVDVTLTLQGPHVVDFDRAIAAASEAGLFRR